MENDAVTLGYWDMRGLCERVRLLLEYLAIPYKEVRFAGSEGRTKWFNEIKPQLFDKNPAITLPYLIDG
jgi:glutathione S-transferase